MHSDFLKHEVNNYIIVGIISVWHCFMCSWVAHGDEMPSYTFTAKELGLRSHDWCIVELGCESQCFEAHISVFLDTDLSYCITFFGPLLNSSSIIIILWVNSFTQPVRSSLLQSMLCSRFHIIVPDTRASTLYNSDRLLPLLWQRHSGVPQSLLYPSSMAMGYNV